jgi:hypothetical protein
LVDRAACAVTEIERAVDARVRDLESACDLVVLGALLIPR